MTDGGPAFPVHPDQTAHRGTPGMSLRDWFAGMALQGLLAQQPHDDALKEGGLALMAFQCADAMLKERSHD